VHGRAPRRGHGAAQHLTADAGVEDLLGELARRVLGVLVWCDEDFAVCEDAVQEALVAAAQHWPATRSRSRSPLGDIVEAYR
jgi:predicted RNA polymerase sigma factor